MPLLFEFIKAAANILDLAFGAKRGGNDAWVSLHLIRGTGEHLEMDLDLYCMFLIIGIPSIKLSEPVVDLSQRNIFVVILQACLRRQEYKRDPNEKKRDQFWGQETNFERSRFSSGSSSKQVLRTLGDTFFAVEGMCVCMCISVCDV